jgi:hypothetical protein
MITLKSLTIVAAVLASGTSLAMAQNGPATGGQPPVAGGGGGNPPSYYGVLEASRRMATSHTRNLYMSAAPGSRHKRLETGQPLPKQPRQAQ